MVNKNDWRLTNQINYLKGARLQYIKYNSDNPNWDHEHCEFCWEKFENGKSYGYCTDDKYYWICEKCFEDFKDIFQWEVKNRI